MRAVVQRVKRACVTIDEKVYSRIGYGLCCLVGVEKSDGPKDIVYMAGKVCSIRIFDDENGVMNLNAQDAGAEIMLISQFTLMGDARKGRRPSYIRAQEPSEAKAVFDELTGAVSEIHNGNVATGRFQTMMDVEIINHGPVTILLDSRKDF